jgi:glycyl-tRNA synthetase beta subunit
MKTFHYKYEKSNNIKYIPFKLKGMYQYKIDENFYMSLKTIANLKPIIDSFFDNVMVMDSDAKIANNRLLLLARTKQLFNKVANFDLL